MPASRTKPTCHPTRKHYLKGLCRACYRERAAVRSQAAHSTRIKRVYGITPEDYARMLAEQGGRCFLCGKRSRKRLSVDHDHETGKVRGLLCSRCNRALGVFEWSVDVLGRLIVYAQRIIVDRGTQ